MGICSQKEGYGGHKIEANVGRIAGCIYVHKFRQSKEVFCRQASGGTCRHDNVELSGGKSTSHVGWTTGGTGRRT